MKQITLSAYNKLHPDKAGIWTTERYDDPNWEQTRHLYMGKRTMLDYDEKHGTVLLIEGLSLEIIDDTTHSPGPWEVQALGIWSKDYKSSDITYCVRDASHQCLAVLGEVDEATAPHNEKNARLMAASPHLLVMLQRILDGVIRLPELPKTLSQLDVEQALKAIKSATGI